MLPHECTNAHTYTHSHIHRHRGLANRSEEDRPLLYLNYARAWYEDSINFTPRSLLLSGSEDIQAAKAEYASKNAKSQQAEYFLRQQQYMQQ